MKQITLSEGEFKSLLDGVKHSAAIDDCRPMLQYIRIEVEKNKITAYTLDGYRASRFVINRKTATRTSRRRLSIYTQTTGCTPSLQKIRLTASLRGVAVTIAGFA